MAAVFRVHEGLMSSLDKAIDSNTERLIVEWQSEDDQH